MDEGRGSGRREEGEKRIQESEHCTICYTVAVAS